MKKFFLFLLLATPAFSSGPKYHYKEPLLDDEVQNVYHDIRNVLSGTIPSLSVSSLTATSIGVSTITASSATITNLTVTGTLTVSGALGKLVRVSSCTSSTAFSTTSSAFQATNLACATSLSSATNWVKISVASMLRNGNTNATNLFWSLDRSGTDLGAGSSGGFGRLDSSLATLRIDTPVSFFYVDAPGTTSSRTYTATIRSDDNTTSVTFGTSGTQVMVLEEFAYP